MSIPNKQSQVKNFSEADIISSLDKTISDFASFDVSTLKPKRSYKKKKVVSTEDNSNSVVNTENFDNIEVLKTDDYFEKLVDNIEKGQYEKLEKADKTQENSQKRIIKAKTKAKTRTGSISKKKRGFLLLNFFKSLPSPLKGGKDIISFKRQMYSFGLAIIMLAFVSMTTYITYAYVTSNDNNVISKVEKHMLLPYSDNPKVYIVQSDKADIFSNPLFTGIEVGDNVLTYTNSKKVVIYRSSIDRIVNIVNLSNY